MKIRRFGERQYDARDFVNPILIVLLVLIVGFVAFSAYYTVKENEQAVVLRFGRYHATSPPGLNCVHIILNLLSGSGS